MDEIIYGIFKVQYDFALKVWFSKCKIYLATVLYHNLKFHFCHEDTRQEFPKLRNYRITKS